MTKKNTSSGCGKGTFHGIFTMKVTLTQFDIISLYQHTRCTSEMLRSLILGQPRIINQVKGFNSILLDLPDGLKH